MLYHDIFWHLQSSFGCTWIFGSLFPLACWAPGRWIIVGHFFLIPRFVPLCHFLKPPLFLCTHFLWRIHSLPNSTYGIFRHIWISFREKYSTFNWSLPLKSYLLQTENSSKKKIKIKNKKPHKQLVTKNNNQPTTLKPVFSRKP